MMVLEPTGVSCNRYELLSGAWLGESCLFDDTQIRTYSAVAVSNAELAVLSVDEYHRIKAKHPRLVTRHQLLANDLESGALSLDGLKYKSRAHRSNTSSSSGGFALWKRFVRGPTHDDFTPLC
eukprot:TRINITY_DN6347_c1_g4_i1.p2 TRINITY_DN6347_c1_g4~~TRINITY_DN6347_c1_g4_i1.p2  ORF type:complete len:123 (+),score=16.26 TRINITY_DN6347_c1_g4_i1:308-676(+)